MSTDHTAETSGGFHDGSSEHHTFDPEPTQKLSAGEPQTPLWLPAVGVALFVAAGVYLMTGDADEMAQPTPPAPPQVTAEPPNPPVAPRRPPDQKGKPPVVRKLDPEQVRKMLSERKGNPPTPSKHP